MKIQNQHQETIFTQNSFPSSSFPLCNVLMRRRKTLHYVYVSSLWRVLLRLASDMRDDSICDCYFAWLRNMTPRCGIKWLVYGNICSSDIFYINFWTQLEMWYGFITCSFIIRQNKSSALSTASKFCLIRFMHRQSIFKKVIKAVYQFNTRDELRSRLTRIKFPVDYLQLPAGFNSNWKRRRPGNRRNSINPHAPRLNFYRSHFFHPLDSRISFHGWNENDFLLFHVKNSISMQYFSFKKCNALFAFEIRKYNESGRNKKKGVFKRSTYLQAI